MVRYTVWYKYTRLGNRGIDLVYRNSVKLLVNEPQPAWCFIDNVTVNRSDGTLAYKVVAGFKEWFN